jgi:hypothetical protein
MILGLVAMTVGLVSLSLGSVLAWIAWPFAAFTNRMVFWLASSFPHRCRFQGWSFPGCCWLTWFWQSSFSDCRGGNGWDF